jgi:pimeloyl-ACP methyl ester carboxylesterase
LTEPLGAADRRVGVAVTTAEAHHPNRFPNYLADSRGRDGTSRHELPDQTARNGTGWIVVDGRKRTRSQSRSLVLESEHDERIPHSHIAAYLAASPGASYEVLLGAHHALTTPASESAFVKAIIRWFRDM